MSVTDRWDAGDTGRLFGRGEFDMFRRNEQTGNTTACAWS